FVGEGPLNIELKQKVSQMGLHGHVNFIGLLSAEQMLAFYRKMDVIVLPSLHESFGLVLIEALSLGKPVLVSSRFGALDFVDIGITDMKHFIFNPEDPEELAQKLASL